MPSHVAHLIFAEQVRNSLPNNLQPSITNESYHFFTLGAQGPDMFYHNRRRKPSGLEYGARLHRHGYGTASGAMARYMLEQRCPNTNLAAYLFGFVTHVFLDRAIHPYINFFAGWFDPRREETLRWRGAHAYFERLIDVVILRRFRNCGFESYDFFSRVDVGEHIPTELVELLAYGLKQAVPRASKDEKLHTRIEHAYLDARGFYLYTNRTLEQYLAEEPQHPPNMSPTELRRSALLHPAQPPAELDPANESRRPWLHPCFSEPWYTSTLWELLDNAVAAALPATSFLASALSEQHAETTHQIPDAVRTATTLSELIGDMNLSDGQPGTRPCPKLFSEPLPLMEQLESYINVVTNDPISNQQAD
ncbi:MAG: zinc dependent phospholipase C family protein [Spirochaeta sp.]|nr:zinc dependent phospholipase C family protein [Spirochaeta sp.]